MLSSARRAPVVIAALVGLGAGAACKDEGIAALEETRDRVCDCRDAACVNAAMEALVDKPTKKPRKAEAIAREITDCVARIYQQSDARPETDDAAPADAAP